MKETREINFDGLVGPLHNYAGLSLGNVASQSHAEAVSNPHLAAMQGLEKMLELSEQGLGQGFIPPQRRPAWQTLRQIGFAGSDQEILDQAAQTAPHLLASCCSSSAMWTANAATIAASADTLDGRLQFVPANLASNLHRSLEAPQTAQILKEIFKSPDHFEHHAPLPSTPLLFDEGAANHIRLCSKHGTPGLHLFVHGIDHQNPDSPRPSRYPARQSLEANLALSRLLKLPEDRCLFLHQSPEAIDAGVFHNDVISTGNENVFLYHEKSFVGGIEAIDQISARFSRVCSEELCTLEVSEDRVPLKDAVASYLFNSQLVTMPSGQMVLLAPQECQTTPSVERYIQNDLIPGENPVSGVIFMDLRQSMHNGGGPACLRLRVVMTEEQRAQVPPQFWMNPENHALLVSWVDQYYPRSLRASDLADLKIHEQANQAFDALEGLLGISLP